MLVAALGSSSMIDKWRRNFSLSISLLLKPPPGIDSRLICVWASTIFFSLPICLALTRCQKSVCRNSHQLECYLHIHSNVLPLATITSRWQETILTNLASRFSTFPWRLSALPYDQQAASIQAPTSCPFQNTIPSFFTRMIFYVSPMLRL